MQSLYSAFPRHSDLKAILLLYETFLADSIAKFTIVVGRISINMTNEAVLNYPAAVSNATKPSPVN